MSLNTNLSKEATHAITLFNIKILHSNAFNKGNLSLKGNVVKGVGLGVEHDRQRLVEVGGYGKSSRSPER